MTHLSASRPPKFDPELAKGSVKAFKSTVQQQAGFRFRLTLQTGADDDESEASVVAVAMTVCLNNDARYGIEGVKEIVQGP